MCAFMDNGRWICVALKRGMADMHSIEVGRCCEGSLDGQFSLHGHQRILVPRHGTDEVVNWSLIESEMKRG